MKPKPIHPLQWVFDPLQDDPTFFQKKMFGCEAAYLRGLLCLVLSDGNEPWNGLLVCTSKEFHEPLLTDFPPLSPHPILGKWLYLSQASPDFEEIAQALANRILRRDPRIGVEPKPKKKTQRSLSKEALKKKPPKKGRKKKP